ncbi:Small nuclear ribonucleoprotein Sm D3 [Sphaceloma murrayae]|uniref:Small nuclear ribonucleoprotein Sm D3 n=1 Tax=Sphaceloma murrayae TaxID=2082308 RepID=A0A2K1QVN4_9PEZI|nr:Small nuclear ribonucleoprotein Sm D3 [Sphaceloma murrayae]
MKIQQPRRLLVVGKPGCDIARLVATLTGTDPFKDSSGSVAGSIHAWHLKTAYYSVDIPVWLDELANVKEWQDEFSKPEAKEVVGALGGWIYCFNKPDSTMVGEGPDLMGEVQSTMKAIEAVINKACGYSWEGVKLAVALGPSGTTKSAPLLSPTEEWDDLCMEHGFEFIDADAAGKNEYGEALGLDRIRESVETNDWESMAALGADEEEGIDLGDEEAQMNAELWGLKASLLGADDDVDQGQDVDNLEALMQQAMAIREAGAGLPLEERQKFATREIGKVVRDI